MDPHDVTSILTLTLVSWIVFDLRSMRGILQGHSERLARLEERANIRGKRL
jgi:hypothetical protein